MLVVVVAAGGAHPRHLVDHQQVAPALHQRTSLCLWQAWDPMRTSRWGWYIVVVMLWTGMKEDIPLTFYHCMVFEDV